jgi:histidinol-phosphate aminotransferase
MLRSSTPMRSASLLRTARRGVITGPRFTPIVQALPSIVPFVAPDEMERSRGRKFAVRLGANELTFGPSPKAIAAMQKAASGAWMYGDPKSHELRYALADHYGMEAQNIVVGEGVDGLLNVVSHLMIGPGDVTVTTNGTYPTLNYFLAGRGGVVETVPYGRDDRPDLDALVRKAAETDAKMVYLANPDNPSGTWHTAERIEAMIEDLPPGCLLLLDEAYSELGHESFHDMPGVAANDLRVLRTRTFSKGYGMAGARIGYAIGAPEIISTFDKVRNHFGIGRIGQAGALAALQDQPYLHDVRERVGAARARLGEIAQQHGLVPLPSATNFVTMDCGRDASFARVVLAELLERDIFARMPGVAPLDRCIRVSCSSMADLDVFAAALPPSLEAARRRRDAVRDVPGNPTRERTLF